MAPFRLFFGGPDCPPRCLRDLLQDRIDATPAGGEIFWATYYFRDQALAEALLRAKTRGVKIRLTLETNPRTPEVNQAVLQQLRPAGPFGASLRALKHRLPENLRHLKTPRLHIKLYYFSHPSPHVLIGTFNPSGNQPEDNDILAAIGDQDRGHNFLLELNDPRLVSPLRQHLLQLHGAVHGPWERLRPSYNRVMRTEDTAIYLFPRLRRNIIAKKLLTVPSGSVLRLAVSHLNDKKIGATLRAVAARGVRIEILAHDTERRVPQWVEEQLLESLTFRRYRHPQGLPMHNKFILIHTPQQREVLLGSMNLSIRSLYVNHELLLASSNPLLVEAMERCWNDMQNLLDESMTS